MKRKIFATYLGTDDFFPGIVALINSFKRFNHTSEIFILVGEKISDVTVSKAHDLSHNIIFTKDISNPHEIENDSRGFKFTYSKLIIFNLIEFEKVVYLDCDMIILENIEILLDFPHMSAVSAGSILKENFHWKDLNTGVLVVKPNALLFKDILAKIGILPSIDKGDQGFLQSYFPNWPEDNSLHLEHRFNVPAPYLEAYSRLPGYKFHFRNGKVFSQNISILHFWGPNKPWKYLKYESNKNNMDLFIQAVRLWWMFFQNAII